MSYIIEYTGNGTCGKRIYRGTVDGLFDLIVNLRGEGFETKFRRVR